MCGRFTLTTADYTAVAKALDADFDPALADGYQPRYNIAPSDPHWIVCLEPEGSRPALEPATWGFPSPHGPRINARSETMHQRPTFREAVRTGRCGVVADGFFEWSGPRGARQPWWFHRPDAAPFMFAGLYRDTIDPTSGEIVRGFTVLTTRPNALVEPIHDRMPVILDRARANRWLGRTPPTDFHDVLEPIEDGWLISVPVSARVNDVRNDDPECIEAVEPPPPSPEQQSLF